jgi:hypothetical protein
MFHWRVANEPGAVDVPALKTISLVCFTIGFFGTTFINYTFIKYHSKGLSRLWLVNAIATAFYVPFFLLTLLMMV